MQSGIDNKIMYFILQGPNIANIDKVQYGSKLICWHQKNGCMRISKLDYRSLLSIQVAIEYSNTE